MNSKFILGASFALLLLTSGASASTLDVTNNYIFPLAGGGGGAMATLNGVSVEIYCDDFYNSIDLSTDYNADVTTLGTGANLSDTRFGDVTSWETVSLSTGNSSLDSTDDTFFNSGSGSNAVARYDMAAYLVSLYSAAGGNNTANNEIQEAIWTLLDPKAEGSAFNPDALNASTYLEEAANWYTTTSSSALNAFLSRVEIVSPTNMTYSNGLGFGGFQEQIVITPTPEPRGAVWLLLSLLVIGFFVVRRRRAAAPLLCGNA